MKLYHVAVEQEDDWLIGRVLEREGITTQAKTLDELVRMAREAIELMWNETGVQLELIIPSDTESKSSKRSPIVRTRRPKIKLAKAKLLS